MRTIGLITATLLLFPSFLQQEMMPAKNGPARKPSLVKFTIPHAAAFSSTLPPKKQDIIDTTQLKQSNWFGEANRNIEESEYEIKPAGGNAVFASPNRQQNLRAFYTADRLTLEPRTEDNWKLELTVKGVYSGKKRVYAPHQDAIAVTQENKIRFTHNNEFSVEYINNKEGVRQNFIIEKEPVGNPSTISIKLKANAGWFINKAHSTEIQFVKGNGNKPEKKLTYNELKVWDANNKELAAYFEIKKNEVEIITEVENAAYPITIDPLSSGTSGTPDWIGDDADQPDAQFGASLASAGDINGDGYSDVIIGAYRYDDGANNNEGRAFVYYGSASGLSATPNSTPDDADQAQAYFGFSVASAGDVNGDGYSDVVIGAIQYDDGININEGLSFVYYGSVAGLSAIPNSILDDADQANSFFGSSVASAGDVNGDGYSDVIVGAYGYDDPPFADEGRSFVYYGSSTGLSAIPNSILDDADQFNPKFGISVASAGDVNGDGYSDVIIGAWEYDDGANTNEGRAFVYYGSAAGLSVSPDSTPDDADQIDANFGVTVASAGDVNGDGYSDVIIGAQGYDEGVNTNEGRAFVYYGSATGLSLTPNSTPDDADQGGAGFGACVASAGDVNGDGYSDVIIGAPGFDEGVNFSEGRAFVYYGSTTGLSAIPTSNPDDADQTGAGFGTYLASAGDVNGDGYSDVIIGAFLYDDGADTNEGAAFVYHGSPQGLNTIAVTTRESNQEFANMGPVAPAGDINADGYGDVIIGANVYDNGETDEGVAFIYHGSPAGLSITPSAMLESNQASAILGGSCASAGDVNGDGFGDIIIGAIDYSNGELYEGRAFIYHGSATGINTTPAATVESNQAYAKMGTSVAGAGDINGDGYGDIIVGAFNYTNDQANEGRAFVYYGSPGGINTAVVVTLESNQANGYFGTSVAGAGDVNGDGYSDVIVGEYGHINGEHNEGGAFVYYGAAAGLNTIPVILEINQAEAYFGFSVAAAGDVNGDGYGDIIAGAWNYDNGETNEGGAFVFHGSATGITTTPAAIVESNQAETWMGFAVASAGDVNGDGYSDIIVGAPQYDNGQIDEGRAFVYHGSPTGINTTAVVTMESNQPYAGMGYFVAGAGDINADGYSDVLVGVLRYSNGELFEGGVFVYHGNDPGSDKRNNLRLYNSDLITPIQQANMAEPNLFGAGLYAKSPLGRQKGKMVWETVRNGTPFSGSPITNSTTITSQAAALTDLGLSGTELKHQIAKMNPTKATYIRARVKYDLTTAITGQVYGPWRYPEGFLRGRRDIGAVALPVKFISFTAVKRSANALLRWVTTDETPGTQYEVQHSIDGINFTIIKTIQSLNNSRSEYEWLHTGPAKGMNYYRIRAVENNKDVFTAVRQLTFDNPITIQVYPNPVQSGQTFSVGQVGLPFTQGIMAELYDSKGQLVTRYEIPGGSNRFIFPAINLSAGQYQLKLINGQSMLHAVSILVIR